MKNSKSQFPNPKKIPTSKIQNIWNLVFGIWKFKGSKVAVLASFFCANTTVLAFSPPGIYDLYNGEGKKTGEIISTITTGVGPDKSITRLECVTKIELPSVTSPYQFTETDTAEVHPDGLFSFRRESVDNEKKSLYLGERRDKNLVINCDREGQKFSTAIPLSSFDMSEFEMELANSKFHQLKPGESKTLRVFFLDRMGVVDVSRNVSSVQQFPYEEKTVPVLVATTLIKGKITACWFQAETGELLQEEGSDYLMTRVGK